MNGNEVIDLSKPKNTLKPFGEGGLWSKSMIVDLTAGEIVMLTPVDVNGKRDVERQCKFYSSISASRRGQAIQLPFEIEGAVTLEDAIRLWMDAANAEADKFHKKAEEAEIRSKLVGPASARMRAPN